MKTEINDWMAYYLAAMANSAICNGTARETDVAKWFPGRSRINITREEIAAYQASVYADAGVARVGRISRGLA